MRVSRRGFLGSAAGMLATPPPPAHRLPAADNHYRRAVKYIEEVPIPEYRWASPKAYEAFRDLKFGIRIHWGPYSILGAPGESWPFLEMSAEERQRYQGLYLGWNPRGFDADEWMNLFADAGAKMFAFTTKHHDGFSMFDTKTRVRQRLRWTAPGGPAVERCDHPYSIMETPFRRDVTRELCRAARKRDIKIDLYYSHPDWYDLDFRPYVTHPAQVPSVAKLDLEWQFRGREWTTKPRAARPRVSLPDPTPQETARMIARHRAQLTELLRNYGTIDMICFDMWLGPTVWPQLRQTLLALRRLQPDVMFRARGIGNYGDYYTPESFVPGAKENTDVPWFVIYPLGSSFSYEPDPTKHKGPDWIVRNLVDAVAKGGNFMAAVGPDGDGKFHPTASAQLREAGAWLKVNGAGIYSTRPREGALWSEGSGTRFTRTKDGRTVFAFVSSWPGRTFALQTVRPRGGSSVHLLGHPERLEWKPGPEGGVLIDLPEALQDESKRPCRFAWGFRFEV